MGDCSLELRFHANFFRLESILIGATFRLCSELSEQTKLEERPTVRSQPRETIGSPKRSGHRCYTLDGGNRCVADTQGVSGGRLL